MKHLNAVKNYWGLLMDWLATPIIWVFWPLRKNVLGKNVANIISLMRVPLMIWILTKLVNADPWQTFQLILLVGLVQVLDGLDGAVARGLGTSGPWGGAIDGGVDKLNTLMFFGVLAWQLLHNDASRVAAIISCLLLAVVIFLQVCTVSVNNQRQKLTKELDYGFGSRLPAQVNFIASMMVIAICWLIPDPALAGWALLLGSTLMMGLSGWALEDYGDDLQQLQFEKHLA